MPPLVRMELALPYIAGVIDARGHIEINHRHDRPQPRIRVTTKRYGLLDYLARVTGTKVAEDTRGYERRPCSDHCSHRHQHVARQSAYWTVDSARATIVLWNIRPYVVCQVSEVRDGLLAGMNAWPPQRGDTAKQMVRLGWPLPSLEAD